MKITIGVTWLLAAVATSYVLSGCVGGPESPGGDPGSTLNPQPLPPVTDPPPPNQPDEVASPQPPAASKGGGDVGSSTSGSSSSGAPVPNDADAGPHE